MDQLLDLLLFLLPIYIANSSPVVLGGGAPLDLGMDFPDRKRILGDGKTIRGFVGGIMAGTLAGGLCALFYHSPFFMTQSMQFFAAFVLSSGALCGDALGSFIKRRVGVDSGKPFLLDTMMFLIVAMALMIPFASVSLFDPMNLLFFLALTLVLHPFMNMVANRVGLKKVPW
jgi:CDP-2,3-bis-(O-geranylgeranyl)-sn-glycerol synthase